MSLGLVHLCVHCVLNFQVHDGCVHVCEFPSLEITLLSILLREWAVLDNYIVRLVENWQMQESDCKVFCNSSLFILHFW